MQQSHAHNQGHACGITPSASSSSSQQTLHLQLQQQLQPQHPNMEDGTNNSNELLSSLIYNRTVKVHKTNYSDHGSHGVATYPLLHHQAVADNNNNNIGQLLVGGGPDGGAAAAAPAPVISGNAVGRSSTSRGVSYAAGYSLPSSVHMQHQMQQIMTTAATLQQQLSASSLLRNGLLQSQANNNQHQNIMQLPFQQHRHQEYQMMPPPQSQFNNNHGNNSLNPTFTTSSLTTEVGSGQVYGCGSTLTTINTTITAELMEAFNAQIAANHAASNCITNAVAFSAAPTHGGVGNGLFHDYLISQEQQPQHQQSNPMTVGSGNSNNILSSEQVTGSRTASMNSHKPPLVAPPPGGCINYNTDTLVSPPVVDFRNGKKRSSPSIPLHPSQLQTFNIYGGLGENNSCNSAGNLTTGSMRMNSVAEEEAESILIGTDNIQVNSSTVDTAQRLLLQHQRALSQPQQVVNSSNVAMSRDSNIDVASQQSPIYSTFDKCLTQPIEPAFSEKPQSEHKQSDSEENSSRINISPSSTFGSPPTSDFIPNKIIQGEVLTNPSIPSSNSGLDNSEGNLIVRRGDVFRIPKTIIHSHPPSVSGNTTKNMSSSSNMRASDEDYIEYKVISLLGQGTFAQVFHCVERKSDQAVAVKIVKNKPAYTRQAAVEIDVFRKLHVSLVEEEHSENVDYDVHNSLASTATGRRIKSNIPAAAQDLKSCAEDGLSSLASTEIPSSNKSIIRLMCYFMHCSHLCLVFEMLGPNLYEILKKRQFRGLPMEAVRTLVRQAAEGIQLLGKTNVVHCDLKPENILMIRNDVESMIAECKIMGNLESKENTDSTPKLTQSNPDKPESKEGANQWIKLIDFGSACFEGQTAHTYIQSRFYRSPEVLIGLPYDSAIDIWSLGCVAAELFLGLPILPGVHEHDQLGRILEMVGPLPDWMVEQGSKSGKFFKNIPLSNDSSQSEWSFRTRQEYINVLTEEEKRSKGGLAKLEQQQTNRYFKWKRLEDIVMHHGICNTNNEREQLGLFVHFLKGLLHPDPWKRWTAHQVRSHPFLSGNSVYRLKASSTGCVDACVKPYDILWVPPWDASISRRKLIVIQKAKEKEALQAQSSNSSRIVRRTSVAELPGGGCRMPIAQSVPEARAMEPHAHLLQFSAKGLQMNDPPHMSEKSSPSQVVVHDRQSTYSYPATLSSSLGGVRMPLAFQRLTDMGGGSGPSRTAVTGRSFSENMHSVQMSAQQQRLQASLSDLYDVTMVQPPPPLPPIMGAQSFSGIYYQGTPRSQYPHVESELGYALQRPGVVPGIGSDTFSSLRRQTSQSTLISENQMLTPSLSSLTSPTPRFAPPGLNTNYQAITISPGGLLLQNLGLQEHLFVDKSYTAGAGFSLLSQQLEEYSQPDQQQGHYMTSRHNQSLQAASTSALHHGSTIPSLQHCLPFDAHQRSSFTDFSGGWYRHQNVAIRHHDAPSAAHMSLSSIAYHRPHASSFSGVGGDLMSSSMSVPLNLQNNGRDAIHYTGPARNEFTKS